MSLLLQKLPLLLLLLVPLLEPLQRGPAAGAAAAAGLPSAAYPAIVTALGARRQRETDPFASMLVQILGVKESHDLEEGFGAVMQNLLSGGLEKAHAEKKGRGGTGVGGQMEHDGNQEGSWMDGGGKDGRDGKGGQWREHLKGGEWERYVDGMAWILEHGGGEGREFRCSHCSEGGSSSSSSSSSSIGGGGSSSSVGATTFPKGMCVSGVGATDFALSVAAVLSTPEYCKESDLYFLDGNTASKTRVEDAAIETARERLSMMARGEGGAAGRAQHGVWPAAWCVASSMVSGQQHGEWPAAWCVASSMVCGQQHGVWPAAWCVASSMVCGQQHGVWPAAW
ncbi:unnamed protein product [Closterium sp. Naga37s-1]|nr:unnamed protein product [Closterium sp. Naga37s-1]